VADGAAFLELTLLLLENGADPNLIGAWGSPLHVAAASDKAGPDEVKLLLDWGADAKAVNQWGIEPLVEAVTASNPSLGKIALLLEAGADVNALFDWNGHHSLSVLMAAAMNGTGDIVELLLDNGAMKYSESSDGLSAYDYALKAERMDNVFLLR
jgi:ankyrin repeat protein